MARYTRHNSKAGIISLVVVIALAIAFVIGVCSNWFTKFWRWSDDPVQTEQGGGEQKDTTGVILNSSSRGSGMKLMSASIAPAAYEENGISPQAQSAYTLTAEFEDTKTTYQEIAFKAYYADGTDTGIDQILQITQSGMSATVSLLKAFNKQIIVEAYSVKHPETKVTATFDYIYSTFFCDFNLNEVANEDNTVLLNLNSEFDFNAHLTDFSNGTIKPDPHEAVLFVADFGQEFQDYMKTKGYTVDRFYTVPLTIDGNYFIWAEYETDDGDTEYSCDNLVVRNMLYKLGNITYFNQNTDEGKAYWHAVSEFYLKDFTSSIDLTSICLKIFDYAYGVNRIYKGVEYGKITSDDYQNLTYTDFNVWDCSAFDITSNLKWNSSTQNSYVF